jgi:hypothetical protein
MLWLIPRVLVLWLALIAICVAGIGIGRLDHTPDALQVLGFDVCDGEACFRGVKPGMPWTKAQEKFPNALVWPRALGFLLSPEILADVMVTQSEDGATVDSIFGPTHQVELPRIELGTIVARYGAPCRVVLGYTNVYDTDTPTRMGLIYPTFTVQVSFEPITKANAQFVRSNYRLQSNMPIEAFRIYKPDPSNTCVSRLPFFGSWYGFTLFEIYEYHILNASGSEQP